MSHKAQGGFTLIELMVTLVILAILGSIAASVFRGSGQDAERSRIIAEMSALNDAMGRYYQSNYSYAGATMPILRTQTGARIEASPSFNVTVDVPDEAGQTYVLIATPVAGTIMEGSGILSVNQAGQRCVDPIDAQAGNCTKFW